jgi:Zn-dependent protease with chaperone function
MNDVASSFASICLTYLVRSLAAYAIFGLLCRVIRDPRLRFQLCVVFLATMVMGWLGSFVHPGPPANPISRSVASPIVPGLSWPLTLHLALSPRLAIRLSHAEWIYLVSLTLLLLQFCVRFWRLRILLSASEVPSKALQARFESLRSRTLVSPCELRLVPGLPSPAAAGWWHPKVLLPCDLLSRLETQQLNYVLRHELIHVRRRDYLWDGMATLGCYLLFFHPAAWLVRRRLRWERELICDEGAVQESTIDRLKYAACLTAVAGWRWRLDAEPGNPIEFLSSTSLAARVHALASPPPADYSPGQKALLVFSAGVALAATACITPDVAVTGTWSGVRQSKLQESPTRTAPVLNQQGPLLKSEQRVRHRRHKIAIPEMVAPDQYSRLTPVQQVHSTPSTLSEGPSILSASNEEQSHEDSARPPKRWGFARRVGTWTVHSMKLGVAKLGAIRQKRQNNSAESSPELTLDNSTNPL